ncbi:MAG: hypothetical protein IJ218_04440 [Alphaproteobacteria bacterium]|nr:hypothetical protein [Alphaproteobacteria bacterium]
MKELYTQEILKNKQNHYEHITKRERVISAKGGKSCIAVAVERKSRYYILRKIPDKSATSMNNALIDMLKNTIVKTITYDN